jgi:hypothetical protein
VKKCICLCAVAAAMLVLLSGFASAAPSFFSTSGNILTPDDSILGAGEFTANYHVLDLSNTANVLGASFGAATNLELGIARFDTKEPGFAPKTMINGKYALLTEKPNSPTVVIGVLDATGDVNTSGDPSLYVVLGKNLTSLATNVTGEPAKPLRAYLGFGTGIYQGLFVAANWSFTPRATIIVEYLTETKIKGALEDKAVFNAGLRFAITDMLSGDVALLNAEDLGFGISFHKSTF